VPTDGQQAKTWIATSIITQTIPEHCDFYWNRRDRFFFEARKTPRRPRGTLPGMLSGVVTL